MWLTTIPTKGLQQYQSFGIVHKLSKIYVLLSSILVFTCHNFVNIRYEFYSLYVTISSVKCLTELLCNVHCTMYL